VSDKELLNEIIEIRKLLELLAEPAIAQRDAKLRKALLQLVGTSETKQKSVHLMSGTLTQTQIRAQTGVNAGNLSTLVGKMNEAKLLTGDPKFPKLSISILPNFFESNDNADPK
jgi:hypothetical protein